MFNRKNFLKGFLIIIFSLLFLFNFKGIIFYSWTARSETLLLAQQSINTQEEIGEIRKIWEGIPRWQGISSKIRNFWNYSILSRFQTHSQQEEERVSWKERIESFFREQYKERRLIIQREIKEEKRELIELTPIIIIEIWEALTEIRPIIIRLWERLKYFYSFLRNIIEQKI